MTSLLRIVSAVGLVCAASALTACGGGGSEPTSQSSSDALKHHKSASSSGGDESCGCDEGSGGGSSGGKCEYTCSAYGYAEGQCNPGFGTSFLCQDGCIIDVASCPSSGSTGDGADAGTSSGSGSTSGGSSGGGFGQAQCTQGDVELGQYNAPCADEGLTAAGQCVEGSENGGLISWTCKADGCATGLAGVGCGSTTNIGGGS